ncbi:MAG: 3-keto-5-aminohexanoate cleavage protein, partial [candidate division WS1 bacterium]|nr:3-keto-5-aminohexanoate cleavage protein [candidate division WS1 bacterium]
ATAMALAAGGGVRVGLEDNLWLDEARSELATNAALVERTVALGRLLGRSPASAVQVRQRICPPLADQDL